MIPLARSLLFVIGCLMSSIILALLSTVQMVLYHQREKKISLNFNPKRNERTYSAGFISQDISIWKRKLISLIPVSTISTRQDGKWTVCGGLIFLPNFIESVTFPCRALAADLYNYYWGPSWRGNLNFSGMSNVKILWLLHIKRPETSGFILTTGTRVSDTSSRKAKELSIVLSKAYSPKGSDFR